MRDFMHKLRSLILPIVLMGLFLFCASFTQAEQINDFATDIRVQDTGQVQVEEVITYDFGEVQKHGIYRDIPVNYTTQTGDNLNIDLDVRSVTDLQGNVYQHNLSRQGNNLRIKIGDPDQTIAGIHVYKIIYHVSNVVNFFDQHDELYWNVTGNDWPVAIDHVQARVSLPSKVSNQDFQNDCFTGSLGSTDKNCTHQISEDSYLFSSQQLSPGQGLTIVAGWPKGIVQEPSSQDKVWRYIISNLIILLPIITFIILFILWYKLGRDEPGKGAIVPTYAPPRKLTPGEIGTIIDEEVNKRDVACTIIDLARKGYYKIKHIESKTLGVFKKTDWEFIKLKDGGELLEKNQHEWEIFSGIFGNKNDTVKLSKLTDFHLAVRNYRKALYAKVTNKKYFFKNPDKVRIFFFFLSFTAVVLFSVLIMLLAQDPPGLVGSLSFFVAVFFSIIFSIHMPRKTRQGRVVYEEIKGFKIFLSATEKDRVKFHFSPESNPEKFSEYVPYAIALGVEKEWAQVFKDITLEQPGWYEGQTGQLFNSLVLISALSNFTSDVNHIFSPKGSTAAGGGSGFSGGFSGGGFGGGGGGSW